MPATEPKKRTRKMVNIDVVETSGVDHPAHLHEGWAVMKSASKDQVEAIFGKQPVTKEETVAEDNGPTQEAYDLLKSQFDALVEEKEALVKAANTTPEANQEELLKSVPDEIREMLNKQAEDIRKAKEDAAADREAFLKERDARLDAAAVSESREMFKSLAFDHDKVAPALRRLSSVDSSTADAVLEVLKAAEGQLESAGIFSEIGKSATDSTETASAKAEIIAKSLIESDKNLTPEQAVAKAYADNPALYTAYLEGK